jgi:hypothetical protein
VCAAKGEVSGCVFCVSGLSDIYLRLISKVGIKVAASDARRGFNAI